MRTIELREYDSAEAHLSGAQRSALLGYGNALTIKATSVDAETYELTAGSHVGIIQLEDLTVRIVPKLPINRVTFLISYALDPKKWRTTITPVGFEDELLEAVVLPFVIHVRTAFRRGLLEGYRTLDDSLSTLRGRIRVGDQIRRQYRLVPPIEVQFDEYTEDIDENRLVKAALNRLRRLPLREESTRQALRSFDAALATVTSIEYHPRHVPEVRYSRLNEHYQPAIELARLIIAGYSLELREGPRAGVAFLVDMNKVFEDFVYRALREALHCTARDFPQGGGRRRLSLDADGRIDLQPDLSWWVGDRCVFVGDVKYKRTDSGDGKNPDLYQLLAYTAATGLETGLLIYALGARETRRHYVPSVGKELVVEVLDLSVSPDLVLSQVDRIAGQMRRQASTMPVTRAGIWSVGA